MTRFAIYARVSTDRHKCRACGRQFAIKQAQNEKQACPKCQSTDIEYGQDPETQVQPLADYAGMRGGTAVLYVDRGISGSTISRPELDCLMKDARQRKFDVVLVARFDRFARSVKHLLDALETFESLGVSFISLTEGIDTTTPLGKMVFTVIGAVAELERSLIRERVNAGLDRARRKGKKLGRPYQIIDKEKVIAAFERLQSYRLTAKECGISKDSVGRIIRRSPDFKRLTAPLVERSTVSDSPLTPP